MVHWLLHDAGAKPNPIDRFGRTPLEDAVGAPALLCHHLLLLVHVVVAPLWLCWHGAYMTTCCGWCTATDPERALQGVCMEVFHSVMVQEVSGVLPLRRCVGTTGRW